MERSRKMKIGTLVFLILLGVGGYYGYQYYLERQKAKQEEKQKSQEEEEARRKAEEGAGRPREEEEPRRKAALVDDATGKEGEEISDVRREEEWK